MTITSKIRYIAFAYSIIGSLLACSPEPWSNYNQYNEIPCGLETGDYKLEQWYMKGMKANKPVDYIEWRAGYAQSGVQLRADPLAGVGTKCAHAAAPAACLSSLSQLAVGHGLGTTYCRGECAYEYFAITRADEVAAVATVEELKLLLLPIDSPEDAVMKLMAEGFVGAACNNKIDGAYRQVADGYEIVGFTAPLAFVPKAVSVREAWLVRGNGDIQPLWTSARE